jgi:hypothetical protein
VAKKLEIVPFVAVPIGYMRCVACSDFRKRPGQMWLGYNPRTHEDEFVDCPVCHGTGQVTRLKHVDIRTGQEIDYERPGQRFVQTGVLEKSEPVQAPSRIILT